MEHNLKKIWPALAVTFATLTSVVCAVDDMQIRNLENRVNALEQRRGANGMINPPARPVVRDGTDLWIQAELLYLNATEDCLSYTIKNKNATTTVDGSVKNVQYDWSPGFRVGIGYNLPHDGWDMLVNWTWFRSHEKKKNHSHTGTGLFQTQTNVASTVDTIDTLATEAEGRASLHLNILDGELGREFFVSKWLTLRPFMGIRGIWVNRGFGFEYDLANNQGTEIDGHTHNRFRGAGLIGGLNTQWGLGSGWSFYGNITLALIYGVQRLHQHQDREVGETEGRIEHLHNHWTIVRPMLDLGAGLRWDHLFDNDAYRIRLQLGWEQHNLFGFEKDMNFVSGVPGKFAYNSGDLSLSGVAFQARFDF